MCSHQLKIVSYEIEFYLLILWRFFVIQVDVFSSVLLWIKSRIARANNKMGVHWRHASFELFACTFRAMHATNFVHIKDHSVCRFVVRHRHRHRCLVNNSPFWCKHRRTHTPIQLNRIVSYCAVLVQCTCTTDCCYALRIEVQTVLFTLSSCAGGETFIGCVLLGFGEWCEPEMKSNIIKWESENKIMFISPTKSNECHCRTFPLHRLKCKAVRCAALVPFLQQTHRILRSSGTCCSWNKTFWMEKTAALFSSTRIWYNHSDYEWKRTNENEHDNEIENFDSLFSTYQ